MAKTHRIASHTQLSWFCWCRCGYTVVRTALCTVLRALAVANKAV
jgi:hypothetical protein